MTQLTDYPPPTTRTAPPAAPPARKGGVRAWQVVVGGLLLLAAVGSIGPDKEGGDTEGDGGSFYAAAGWTVGRVADFEVDLERDAGWSDARAECAAKDVAGNFTWYVWSDMSHTGKLTAAEMAAC